MTTPQTRRPRQSRRPEMIKPEKEPTMTPDELAMHLSDIAKEHGAALTEITFLTHTGTATGTHSYSAITSYRMDSPLPDTIFVAKK